MSPACFPHCLTGWGLGEACLPRGCTGRPDWGAASGRIYIHKKSWDLDWTGGLSNSPWQKMKLVFCVLCVLCPKYFESHNSCEKMLIFWSRHSGKQKKIPKEFTDKWNVILEIINCGKHLTKSASWELIKKKGSSWRSISVNEVVWQLFVHWYS